MDAYSYCMISRRWLGEVMQYWKRMRENRSESTSTNNNGMYIRLQETIASFHLVIPKMGIASTIRTKVYVKTKTRDGPAFCTPRHK